MKPITAIVSAAALASLAAPAAMAQGAGAWFYCLGFNPQTGGVAASQVFRGDPASLDVYKQQVGSYLISLGLLPAAGGEVACAWAGTEAQASADLAGAVAAGDARFDFAPGVLGGGARPAASASEPNALELPAAELAAIEEHNRRELERRAQINAELDARREAAAAAAAEQQAQYEAARAEYEAAQQAYQRDLARQQAAVAEYERQRAAYEAAIAAGATPVPGAWQ